MTRNLLILLSSILVYLLFFQNCANPSTPTGGPRDTIPPLLVESAPINKSINFKGNRIELIFDEYVKLDQVEQKLIITPTIESEYKTRFNKDRVTIIFEEDSPFKENTTYTLNFQDAIKDINESNVWKDPRFVFSTGDYLDSLYVYGNVNFLMTKEAAKEGIVSLYFIDDTLNVLTDKPPYFTNIDEEGKFIIENLPAATFNVYAIKDGNNNLILDANSEAYDFTINPVEVLYFKDSIKFQYQFLNINNIKIFSTQSIRGNYDISFNKYITDFNFNTSNYELYPNFVDEHDKVRFYDKPISYPFDSLLVNIEATDSVNNKLDTSLYINFEPYEGPKPDLTQSFVPENNFELKSTLHGFLTFNKPIYKINYDSIFIMYDSVTYQYLDSSNLNYNKYKDQISIKTKLDKDKLPKNDSTGEVTNKFNLYIGKGSFVSIEQDSSKSINRSYSFYDPANYGIIKGNINSSVESFTIELLDTKYNVIDTIKNNSKYVFDKIKPGSYYIRVLFDVNNNSQWDPGSLLDKQKPEPVIFYYDKATDTRALSIKANWEMTDINIDYNPVD